MALPLPEGQLFHIEYRVLPADYEMPSLEAAFDHYALGYHIRGDRTTITPDMIFTSHPGYVSAMAPFVYHRTIPASREPYESILIKFSPLFVRPLTERFGQRLLDDIYSYPANHFTVEIREQVRQLFFLMLEEYRHSAVYSDFKLQCMLSELLLTIAEYRLPEENASVHPTTLTPPIIEAVYYMEKHYAENITIDDVAGVANYSASYFSRLFHVQLGKPYTEYLGSIRLKNAQRLLLSTDKSVTEIALESGYQYPGNLTAAFKKRTGMTPQQYRKQMVRGSLVLQS